MCKAGKVCYFQGKGKLNLTRVSRQEWDPKRAACLPPAAWQTETLQHQTGGEGGGDGGGRETEHFKLTAAGTILLQRGQLYNLVLYSIILWVFSESTPKLMELNHSVKLIL